MTNENAAGRKTERAASGIENTVDRQLALMTDGMRDALTRAGAIPLGYDDRGIARAAEFHSAVLIAKSSAQLVLALAKLNGQFNHDINVRHVAPPEG